MRELKEDYYAFISHSQKIFDILSPAAGSAFVVSGDQSKHRIISSIIQKMDGFEKSPLRIFERKAESALQTKYGKFAVAVFQSKIDHSYVLALIKGIVAHQKGVLTRVHSSCMTGDIFGSLRCDCGPQLHKALRKIDQNKEGVLIYLFQEGRGVNIINKIRAYKLQEEGFDTVDANLALGLPVEMREYSAVRDILQDLKVKSIRLMTNNPEKILGLENLGVVIESRTRLAVGSSPHNRRYLVTKKTRMNHKLAVKNDYCFGINE